MAVITGTARNDVLIGTVGNDQIFGLEGDDTLDGAPGDDAVVGGYGRDTLTGGLGNNVLFGFSEVASNAIPGLGASNPDGGDVFYGGPGNNVMWGGTAIPGSTFTGDDTFYIGRGNDAAAGGDGVDTAVFELPRGAYTVTTGPIGFPTAADAQLSGTLVERNIGLGVIQTRLIEVENLSFLDGRVIADPNAPAAQVVRIYQAALDRPPDPAGLEFWASRLAAGVPVTQVAAAIATSPEFQERFGATGAAGYVQQLYRNVLGREGDPPGVSFWVDRLNAGASRGDVLVGFANSAENRATTDPVIQRGIWIPDQRIAQVARLYDTAFDRAPDPAGLAAWRNALDTGATVEQIAQSFTTSPEFQALYGGPTASAAALVDGLYRNTLDRAPDPAGQAFWVQQIQSGTLTPAQVVLSFSESAEHRANTAADTLLAGLR